MSYVCVEVKDVGTVTMFICALTHIYSIHPHVLAAPFSSIAMKYQQDAIMHQNTIYTGVGQKN